MTYCIVLKESLTTLEACYLHLAGRAPCAGTYYSSIRYHVFMNSLPKRSTTLGELGYALLLFKRDLRLFSHVFILNGQQQFLNLKIIQGNTLAVQCLGLSTSTAVARVQSLTRELRSHKPHGVMWPKKRRKKKHLGVKELCRRGHSKPNCHPFLLGRGLLNQFSCSWVAKMINESYLEHCMLF